MFENFKLAFATTSDKLSDEGVQPAISTPGQVNFWPHGVAPIGTDL